MRIIARYITKEILCAFAATLGLLFLILLSNRFAFYLGKAASGALPLTLVLEMLLLYSPELLSYLIPLSLYVAILLALGRLYNDSEMTILSACAIPLHSVFQWILSIALGVAFLTACLTLWLVPRVALWREALLSQQEFAMMRSLMPQRFQSLANEQLIFYLEEVSKEGLLKGVFIAERPLALAADLETRPWVLMSAATAALQAAAPTLQSPEQMTQSVPDALYLVLHDGHRYQGVPGRADYKVIHFEEYGRLLEPPNPSLMGDPSNLRLKNSLALCNAVDPESAAEWQWRLSLPISVFVLAMMAIPLAYLNPRQGRFARFLPAIILYVVYYNLFTVCRRWVAMETLPSFIGVWWVHLTFVGIAWILLWQDRVAFRTRR